MKNPPICRDADIAGIISNVRHPDRERMLERFVNETFKHTMDSLVSYIKNRGFSQSEAKEIAREIYDEAYLGFEKSTHNGNRPNDLCDYFFKICMNRFARYMEKMIRDKKNIEMKDNLPDNMVDDSPITILLKSEFAGKLEEAFHSIGEKCRQLLTWKYIDQKSHAEIEAILNRPEDWSKVATGRCKNKLKDWLRDHYDYFIPSKKEKTEKNEK